MHGTEHLVLTAAVAIDGNAFAPQLMGQSKDLVDIRDRGVRGQIDGLGYRVVHVFLKGGLDADMPFGCDAMGGQ